MISGHVRDFMPRLSLSLPGHEGPVVIEFIVDTGFDGELSLPSAVIERLDVSYGTERTLRLADGSLRRQISYQIVLDWNDEERITEIDILESNPLLGAVLLDGMHVSLDMTDGGEVQIEPL